MWINTFLQLKTTHIITMGVACHNYLNLNQLTMKKTTIIFCQSYKHRKAQAQQLQCHRWQ